MSLRHGLVTCPGRFWTGLFLGLVGGTILVRATCVHFSREHVDLLSVRWNAADRTLGLMAYAREQGGALYASNQCAVLCPESMQFELPAGTPLGSPGDPLWILPQNPYLGVPYVGASAEGVPEGLFAEPFAITLHEVEGPGHFILWQVDGRGAFTLWMDTRDGIDRTDRILLPAGAHAHFNWGFTTNGTYRLYFRVEGWPVGTGEIVASPVTPFTIHVLPLRPFERWITNHWPCACERELVHPNADPDKDGIPNLLEYGLGLDPNVPLRVRLPECVWTMLGGTRHGALRYWRSSRASDLQWWVEVSPQAQMPDGARLPGPEEVIPRGDLEEVLVPDVVPVDATSARFYRLRVRWIWP